MQPTPWYTSKPAIVFYHLLTWLVTLFLPFIMRSYLDEKREAGFGLDRYPASQRLIRYRPAGRFNDSTADFRNDSAFRQRNAPYDVHPRLRQNDSFFRSRGGSMMDSNAHYRTGGFEGGRGEHGPPFVTKIRMEPSFFSNLAMVLNIIWIGLFYLNAYYFIPRFVYVRKWAVYLVWQVAIFLSVSFFAARFMQWHMGDEELRVPMPVLMNIFPFLFVQAGSLAYRLIVDKIRSEKLGKEKENEGLKTELSFLRSQISPHFIFNVLNNMVSLARKKSDMLEPSLIRLSGLLRYMLYESDETKVKLSREIEYLRSYIDLQSLRFGNEVNLQVDLQSAPEEYFIEPMLLIPFVENAFKHSASYLQRPLIEISLRADNGLLKFKVNNQFERGVDHSSADRVSGIGLNNVRRRLNLLYGSNHRLLIAEKENFYTVSLEIKLS